MPTGRHVLANEVRPDGQLAVPAVDEAQQLDRARAAEIDQRVGRRANGASGVQDVVYENDGLVGDVDRDRRRAQRAGCALVDVVAVEGDVQLAERGSFTFELQNALLHAAGEREA